MEKLRIIFIQLPEIPLKIITKEKDIPSEELLKSEDCSKNHVEELGVRLTIEQAVRKLPEEIRETAVLYFFRN